MENKLKFKKVGGVEIFEFFGNLTGAFAAKSLEAMERALRAQRGGFVLFNVQFVDSIDSGGMAALFRIADQTEKKAFLLGGNGILETLKRNNLDQKWTLFRSPEEATYFFSREFAIKSDFYMESERRQFLRLKTVLPLRFSPTNAQAGGFEFFSVVTNLSEGGLFAEFIDSVSETKVDEILQPYGIYELRLQLFLSPNEKIYMQGQKVHGGAMEGGVGIAFTDMEIKTRERLRAWIEGHLVQHPEARNGQEH